MDTATALTPLPRLGAVLRDLTGDAGPGYRKLYALALDGKLPTEIKNGRHYVQSSDVAGIAKSLGLTVAA